MARWKDLLARLSNSPSDDLEVNSLVLLENPDYYPCWNARKRFILSRFQELKDQKEALMALIKDELDLNVRTIKRNPKSYFAWYHRRWLLQEATSKVADVFSASFDPTHEIALCTILLSLDQRNCSQYLSATGFYCR